MEKHLLTCETCGGVLNYAADGKSAVCPFCGNEYYFKEEKSEALVLALNRANAYRLSNDFDGAITEYKLVAERNPSDAEAFWGLAISTYGIEYVEDPRTKKRVPTCRRTVKKSILEDENYLKALENATKEQKEVYERRAAVIDRLQKNIKRRLEDEEDFDVFISFKSTDEEGKPTKERGIARRIYDELTKRKIKTFFSEVTLRDRIGEDFEPIIFKALYSCKFFILVATSEENMNSAWVKNEWSRFRDRVFDENLSGAGCAVFEGIKPSALPPFLRGQGINLAKYPAGGYEIEIADALSLKFGLTKKNDEAEEIRRQIEEQKRVQKALEEKLKAVSSSSAAPASGAGATVNSLLMRAKQEGENGDFVKATSYYNKVLDADPVNFEAWLGLFFSTQNTTEEKGLIFRKESSNATQFYESEKENERLLSAIKGKYFFNAKKYADAEQMKRIQAAEERAKAEKTKNTAEMAQNLQLNAESRIAQSDFDTAIPMLDAAVTVFPEKAELWWDRFLAECSATSPEMLLGNLTPERYNAVCASQSYKKALDFADKEDREILEGFHQQLKEIVQVKFDEEQKVQEKLKKEYQIVKSRVLLLTDVDKKPLEMINEEKVVFLKFWKNVGGEDSLGMRVIMQLGLFFVISLFLGIFSCVALDGQNLSETNKLKYSLGAIGGGVFTLLIIITLISSLVTAIKSKRKEEARIAENRRRKKINEERVQMAKELEEKKTRVDELGVLLSEKEKELAIYRQKTIID